MVPKYLGAERRESISILRRLLNWKQFDSVLRKQDEKLPTVRCLLYNKDGRTYTIGKGRDRGRTIANRAHTRVNRYIYIYIYRNVTCKSLTRHPAFVDMVAKSWKRYDPASANRYLYGMYVELRRAGGMGLGTRRTVSTGIRNEAGSRCCAQSTIAIPRDYCTFHNVVHLIRCFATQEPRRISAYIRDVAVKEILY